MAAGAKVVVGDPNKAKGEIVAATAADSITFLRCDVTSTADWERLVETAFTKFGRLDILVNNAGTTYPNKPTSQVTAKDYDLCFDVNVKSIYIGTQIVIPRLVKQGSVGSIINISSVSALRPRPGLIWYSASNGAVLVATKGLAGEYAPHQVRVNGICPLLSGTGLFESFVGVPDTPEYRAKLISNMPMGRLADPLDIANAALFFASDESKFVTGVNMEVDGGRAIA